LDTDKQLKETFGKMEEANCLMDLQSKFRHKEEDPAGSGPAGERTMAAARLFGNPDHGIRPAVGALAFSFFNWLVSLFAGVRNNPERARKRGLKRIAKAIAANAYGKFFRTKSVEAAPDMAQFFYDVYRVIVPAQVLFQNAAQSKQLKLRTVANFMDKTQRDMLERLSAENIEKRAEEIEEGLLYHQMQSEFSDLVKSFDDDRRNAINECYSLILIICQFVSYDYYFLLKKFDFQLTEYNFSRIPVFTFLRGEAVVEELKDFLELTSGLDPNRGWIVPLRILGEYKGLEAIKPEAWNSMLLKIQELVSSEIFELIIRFVEKDPTWTWTAQAAQESIVGSYLEMIRGEIFDRLELIFTAKRNALIDRHVGAVFGDVRVRQLKYYTEEQGEIYKKKKLPGFTEARALNYLIIFLTDKRPEIQNLYELLLIRGYWVSMTLSLPLSEALWRLAGFPARITEMDAMLSDWGLYGAKLKTAMMNVDRNESMMVRSIARILGLVNGEARQIINDAIFNLAVLLDGMKLLLEDCRKNPGFIIQNWEELNYFSERGLESRIVSMRDKLTNMLELLRVLSRNSN
jgi:hypothetical protein